MVKAINRQNFSLHDADLRDCWNQAVDRYDFFYPDERANRVV